MTPCTLIVPYYRNPQMLREQLAEWALYPPEMRVILVDDGSPERALAVVMEFPAIPNLQVYRIMTDIPWNRGGARNLGSHVAETKWLVHIDIDHLLPAANAARLVAMEHDRGFWYRFPRFRRGRADETRRKDQIPEDQEFGEIHPHIDSYLIRRDLYWKTGGYDEDYSGCLGGGSPFLKRLEATARMRMLPENVFLCVYTRSACPDASDNTLSRDTGEYSRRRQAKEREGSTKPERPLRFGWERVL